MLRSEHSILRYDFQSMRVHPDRLRQGRHDAYLGAAEDCLRLYRSQVGQTRQSLHRSVEQRLARLGDCPPRRTAAFCKLLDDLGEFHQDRAAAVALRQQVFRQAAPWHPIVTKREGIFERDAPSARAAICQSTGLSWAQIEARLFADVIELQTLRAFPADITPHALLSRYNVAQTQTALYRATRVCIDAEDDFKLIARHAKLAGLMHQIIRHGTGYRFILDGPASDLRETTRYGVKFAAMIPMLLTARRWSLTAEILGPGKRRMRFALSPRDALQSSLEKPPEFDSQLEQQIDAMWREQPLEGWTWRRESELLLLGQSVLTPDFVLQRNVPKASIYIEVVGYWTPEYLTEKCRRLEQFTTHGHAQQHWLLVFPRPSQQAKFETLSSLDLPMVVWNKKTSPQQWITAAGVDRKEFID